MPQPIPPFVQYQQPLPPLRGLWNAAPVEGDRFVSAEVDWILTTDNYSAVQFNLAGSSPMAMSQIVALSVDNSRCGVDVIYLFPDTGFTLTVPAHTEGTFPVFTNALMFYLIAQGCASGDITVFQALNSMPPPVQLTITQQQTYSGVSISNVVNGTTQIVPPGTNGTLTTINITIVASVTAGNQGTLVLQDGTGKTVWATNLAFPTGESTETFPVTGIRVRFTNGLNMVLSGVLGFTSGQVDVNVYYLVP